jgi:protein-L-isoaspartate O-methyltransferase
VIRAAANLWRRYWPCSQRALLRHGAAATFVVAAALLAAPSAQQADRHPVSGRVYAQPMGVAGADWLDRPERDAEEQPARALALLKIRAGDTVADVGAGSGYFTERLARLVGPAGRVYANDLQRGMLDRLWQRMAKARINNVTLVQGAADDPRLPANAFDLILMVDVYHELGAPQTMLGHLKRALRTGGRLVLVEYKGEDPSIPIRPEHKMTVAQARLELESEGFTLAEADSSLPRQHVLVFRPAP